MKGLRKYLTPFAPDQSGASSVFYELGGIIVICDAGGCAGNVCGFDEPRWFTQRSAVFSAGLRDMDAILGRDDRLVAKLADAAGKLDAKFAVVVGTPVPAVIGTDYRALKRLAEKKLTVPVMAVDTTGMALYDEGAEKAWTELVRTFADRPAPVEKGRIGVLGLSPLEVSDLHYAEKLTALLKARGWQKVSCYGMGSGLDELATAAAAERNIAVSPSGLKAAKRLEELYGTPFDVEDPLAAAMLPDGDFRGKKVLVMHQQVTANSLRSELRRRGCSDVCVATWFMKKAELAEAGDLHLTEEDQLEELAAQGGYDVVVADPAFRRAMPAFAGEFVNAPHFAVSGKLNSL